MAAGPFEADLAMPFGVAARGAAASPKLVAILKPGDTSWTVPRTSKYTIHAWGAGGSAVNNGAGAGGYSKKTLTLAKGASLSCSIGRGVVYSGNDGTASATPTATTIAGPGLSLSSSAGSNQSGGAASGGDFNISGGNSPGGSGGAAGGDGSIIGMGGVGGPPNLSGSHPGGGAGGATNTLVASGSGEIRIVDETP